MIDTTYSNRELWPLVYMYWKEKKEWAMLIIVVKWYITRVRIKWEEKVCVNEHVCNVPELPKFTMTKEVMSSGSEFEFIDLSSFGNARLNHVSCMHSLIKGIWHTGNCSSVLCRIFSMEGIWLGNMAIVLLCSAKILPRVVTEDLMWNWSLKLSFLHTQVCGNLRKLNDMRNLQKNGEKIIMPLRLSVQITSYSVSVLWVLEERISMLYFQMCSLVDSCPCLGLIVTSMSFFWNYNHYS